MRILRASDRIAVPWKNGGGVTTEVAVFPPGAGFDDFGWRISIAQINRGGPFSVFPSIDRELGMLEGGVLLSVAGRPVIDLSPTAEPVRFPGDVPTNAELVTGGATDLNVMTRRGKFASRMTRQRNIVVEPNAVAVFAFPLEAITVHGNGPDIRLSRGDALFFSTGQSPALPQADFFQVAIFRAENPANGR
jgi:environmental stress-induced protein Ves